MRLLHVAVSLLVVASSSVATAQLAPDQYFSSNGVRIRYIEAGAGEPVLLVHGYTKSIETNWTIVFQDLVKDHHVIAFDLRGHGKSDKPHDPAMYGDEMVQDAIRLLDHLNLRRVHWVGYSLGTDITAKLVTTHPERFITATFGGSGGSRNWKPAYDSAGLRDAAELETDVPFRSIARAFVARDYPNPTEEQIRALSASLAEGNDLNALAAYRRGGTRPLNSTDSEVAAIKVPVLAVIGSADNVAKVRQLQALLPSMKVVVIDGATHLGERSAVRRPEFTAAIREFIAAHPGGAKVSGAGSGR